MEDLLEQTQIAKDSSYRDSGVEWIGELPTEWQAIRAKHMFAEINERSNKGAEDLLSVSQYTGVTKTQDNLETGDILTNASSLEGYKKVRQDDLVSNIMLAWNGSLGFSPFEGITSPAYSVYRLRHNDNPRYFHYLLRTELYKAEYKRNSSGVVESRLRLYTDDFFRIAIIRPPKEEQTAIATFLDRKTAQIDNAIRIKERQIELLKERRQILIQNAVTKGLDREVKMKESGVEWIGEVPEHWEIQPIKYSLHGIVDCEHSTAPFVEASEYLVVRTSNVKDGKLVLDDAKFTHEKGYKKWTQRGVPEPGDILLTREAPAGEACIVPSDRLICLGQRMVWLKIDRSKINPQFLVYLIYSSLVRIYIDLLSAGSTVAHFNMSDIKNIPIISAPIAEQNQIVKFVFEFIRKSNKTIACKENEIEKLKEYKATLIDGVVTGKVRVV